MKKLLVKNSIFGIIQTLLNLVLVFWAVPIFIKMLGSEYYGVFALIMVIGNLNTFINLGLTNALVKFIAGQGKCKESNIDIIVNFIITISLVLPLSLIVIIFNKFILINVLNIPIKTYGEAKWLYFWVIWANFFLFTGQIFKSVLDALQKIYLTSIQQILYNLLYWGLILVFLYSGKSLPAIGKAIFISAFIWFVITIFSAINVWGTISLKGVSENFFKSAKKQINYGIKIYTSGLIGFFYEPFTKILVSNFIGVTEVGYYDIALRLRGQLWGFIAKIFYPLFPFISEQKDKTVIRKYVHDLEQKTFLVIIPIIVLTIILMKPFIEIWIGNNVDIISTTSIIIISFHLIGSSTVIPNYQFLMAKDLAEKTIILQLSNVIFNALFFFLSVHYFGYYALIIGNVAAIMSSFILSLYYQKKYLNSLIFDSISQVIKLFIVFIILLASGFIIKILLGGHNILIIIIPILLVFLTVPLYKIFNLIKLEDIKRYFGNNNLVAKTLVRIYN